jgi:hypothetical protein
MAVLNGTLRAEILAYLCRRFGYGGAMTKANVQAAINATDSWIDTNAAAFNSALPAAAQSGLSATEKVILFCFVASKRAGIEV